MATDHEGIGILCPNFHRMYYSPNIILQVYFSQQILKCSKYGPSTCSNVMSAFVFTVQPMLLLGYCAPLGNVCIRFKHFNSTLQLSSCNWNPESRFCLEAIGRISHTLHMFILSVIWTAESVFYDAGLLACCVLLIMRQWQVLQRTDMPSSCAGSRRTIRDNSWSYFCLLTFRHRASCI